MTVPRKVLLAVLSIELAACGDAANVAAPPPRPRPNASVLALAPLVVYSNFGPGKAFNPDIQRGWTINGFINPQVGEQAISQQFTPSVNVRFISAEIAVLLAFGPPSIRAVLQTDANGFPGQILEDIPLQGLQPIPTVVTATSTLQPTLRIGTSYWLTVIAGAAGVIGEWNINSIGDDAIANFASTGAGSPFGPWGIAPGPPRGAFQINGAPPTAQDAIQFLIERVSGLVANGTLNQGQGNALLVKLSAAIESLGRDNAHAACGQLGAFINQTTAFVNIGRLSATQGRQLLDLALDASSRVGCE